MTSAPNIAPAPLRPLPLSAPLGPFAVRDWFFYAAFALCALGTLLVRTTFETILAVPRDDIVRACYYVGATLLFARLALCYRTTPVRFALALGVAATGVACFAVARDFRVALLFLFVAAGQGVRLKPLAATALGIHLAVLAVTVPCALLGVIDSVPVWRLANDQWYARWSYGYSHPNMLGEVFLTLTLSYAVLRFPRFHPADLVAYAAALAGAALLVQARTATVGIVLAAALACAAPLLVRTTRNQRAASSVAFAAFAAAAAFSFAAMAFFNPDVAWMQQANDLFSGRPELSNRYFERFAVQPFGNESMMVVVGDFIQYAPDNSYVRMLMKEGLVPALVLGALCVAAYVHAVRRPVYDACIMGLAVYAVVGVMEMYAVNFTLDYFLIGASWALYGWWPGEAPLEKEVPFGKRSPLEKGSPFE